MKKTPAIRILEKHKISFQLLSYHYDPNDLDVRSIAQDNDLDVRVIYKTLVAKGARSGPFVCLIPGDKRMNRKAVAQLTGNKKVNLLPLNELEATTGYIRGGCCPIGMKKALPVFIDQSAETLGKIWFNAGTRGLLIELEVEELAKLCQAELTDISEDYPA